MKILYHGGENIIKQPEIREPERTLDFGKGFYLTTSKRQATDWVHRRLERTQANVGFLNEYEFKSTDAEKDLKIKIFDSPNEDWLDFVMSNRRIVGFEHNYDIVVGPVANDRVYTAFALFEGGTISKEILIRELKTYRLVDQYLFHTPESLKYLVFNDAKEIRK